MDKNKSRSDLLAAGKKKLQQYRRNKDSKGGIKKAGKLENDGEAEEEPSKMKEEASSSGYREGIVHGSGDRLVSNKVENDSDGWIIQSAESSVQAEESSVLRSSEHGGSLEETGSLDNLISDVVVQEEAEINPSCRPEESSSSGQTSETVLSPSQCNLAINGEDASANGRCLGKIVEEGQGINVEGSQLGSSSIEVESIRELLYITAVERDVSQLQLDEQIKLSTENEQQSFEEMLNLRNLLKETQEGQVVVNEGLEQCKSGLQAMTSVKEELETQCLSMEGEMEELRVWASELQDWLDQSQEGVSRVLSELIECRVSLEILQMENLELTESLLSEKDAVKKVIEEKELVSSENKKLSEEVMEQKEQLHSAIDRQRQLQSNLNELKELSGRCVKINSKAEESGSQEMPLLEKNGEVDHDCSSLFGVLKQHVVDANNILHNLEKSLDGMHSHSVSLSRSSARAAGPGISKIIQAFESKAHIVEKVTLKPELNLAEGRGEDSYNSAKGQTCSLMDILIQMELDVGKAETHCRDSLNKSGRGSEVQNQKNILLLERIDELTKKVSDYKSQTVHLQNQLDEVQHSSNQELARLLSQIEMLQNEVNDRAVILKQEEDSIIMAVQKLNTSIGLQISDGLDVNSHVMTSVDAAVLAIKSLNEKLDVSHLNCVALQTSFEDLNKSLNEKLEASHLIYIALQTSVTDLEGKNEMMGQLLKKFYNTLKEFVYDSCKDAGEVLMDANADEILQFLPRNFDLLVGHFQKLAEERHCLLSKNNELESRLLNSNHEVEELNRRCNALSKKLEDDCHSKEGLESLLMNKSKRFEELCKGVLSFAHKLADCDFLKDSDKVSISMNSGRVENEFCQSMLLHLQALVSLHLQKYGELVEQINSSKIYLKEVNIVTDVSADNWNLPLPTLLSQEFVPRVNKLQEELQLISALNIQHDSEIQNLKEGLGKMEEALEATRSELSLKVLELEQSEQRLSSVREKLSIAVAKGKGLIVQRDSLKQSLADKTNELETCMRELQSKEKMFHEVKEKLKSCSEVDRIEALESELSYIRNSATALRDSFLLKDSVLQRIEEVLEDLDLPEHFHSKDIVEKIELLSRFAATDYDQKSSEGHSHSDAGYVVMDNWKDEITQLSLNQEYDELKRKYDELQAKFYGLAEHYDILDQSLKERNSLIEKWEDTLDRIDIPSHLRTMEPEDRIKSLGRALFDIQQERDTLLQKIENFEDSSDMLMVDLEESGKKISELSAELVSIRTEKELFSDSLEKLRSENLALSEKAGNDEVEIENLQTELAELEEKLAEKVKDQHEIETEMRNLHDLVCNALPDSDAISDGFGISSLGALLTKLIDNYKKVNLNLHGDYDKASQSLVLVKEERDATMEKCHYLVLEIEEITRQLNQLQEERTHETQKYQSLVLELEAISKHRDNLQEKLTQEEQKTATAKEKLNVAVRKGKILVHQRDALKQTIEEMTTIMESLKAEHNQRLESLDSEKSFLMNQLAESERNLQESSQNFSSLFTAVHSIDIGREVNIINPIQKMEEFGNFNRGLQSALVSSQQEAQKSRQAAELLSTELNEVQDRADILQEELTKAEAAKVDALFRLEQLTLDQFEERKKQVDNLVELKSCIDKLRKECVEISSLVSNLLRNDVDLLSYVQSFLEFIIKQNGEDVADTPLLGFSSLSIIPLSEENSPAVVDAWLLEIDSHFDSGLTTEHLTRVCSSLHECTKQYDSLKEKMHQIFFSTRQQATGLLEALKTVKGKLDSQKEVSESLNRDVYNLDLAIKEKDSEILSLHRNLSLLYEACRVSITEINNRKAQVVESSFPLEGRVSDWNEENDGHILSYSDHSIKIMVDSLLLAVQDSININETEEGIQRELKASIFNLQREVQEKDIEMKRTSEDFVYQIKEADTLAQRYVKDLDSLRTQVSTLEKKVDTLENDKELLESKIDELKVCEASSKELQDRLKSLTDTLAAKDQEIDDLMQLLDEEELKMASLESLNQELEETVHEKIIALETLETSRAKALAKLSTTVTKFDELHDLSESLILEVESLQSQLQSRDSEISFLRQEVTRCTNDVLASHETTKKYSSEIDELLICVENMVLRFGEPNVYINDQQASQIHVYTDILDKRIISVVNELEDLKLTVQSKDALLQIERGRVEELLRKTEDLEHIHGEEIQGELFHGRRDMILPSNLNSPVHVEIDQMVQRNKVSSAIKTHMRSGLNANNDQIAVAIDMEKDDNVLDDEDDDKAHGFKSLTMSRLVPRATRPMTDRIDGIWVSAERLLMRQPMLRLGVIMYWILLHALLASFI